MIATMATLVGFPATSRVMTPLLPLPAHNAPVAPSLLKPNEIIA